MHDNERGFHHLHKVDKGIMRGVHDINSVGCPDMPGGITSMTPAQRLDYARLWDQSRMPAWRDPRGG